MTSVPPFALEICIVCVGIFLLMMDCFTKLDKRSIGLAAIAGLLAAFVLSFLTGPMPSHVIPPSFLCRRCSGPLLQTLRLALDRSDDRPRARLRPDL